jgi:hypothetical protein
MSILWKFIRTDLIVDRVIPVVTLLNNPPSVPQVRHREVFLNACFYDVEDNKDFGILDVSDYPIPLEPPTIVDHATSTVVDVRQT